MSKSIDRQLQILETEEILNILTDILPSLEQYEPEITLTEIIDRFFKILGLIDSHSSTKPLLLLRNYNHVSVGHLPEILKNTITEDDMLQIWLSLGEILIQKTAAGTLNEQVERLPSLQKLRESAGAMKTTCSSRIDLLQKAFGITPGHPAYITADRPNSFDKPFTSPLHTRNQGLREELQKIQRNMELKDEEDREDFEDNRLRNRTPTPFEYSEDVRIPNLRRLVSNEDTEDEEEVTDRTIPEAMSLASTRSKASNYSDQSYEEPVQVGFRPVSPRSPTVDMNGSYYVPKPDQMDDVTVGDGTWGRIQARNRAYLDKRKKQNATDQTKKELKKQIKKEKEPTKPVPILGRNPNFSFKNKYVTPRRDSVTPPSPTMKTVLANMKTEPMDFDEKNDIPMPKPRKLPMTPRQTQKEEKKEKKEEEKKKPGTGTLNRNMRMELADVLKKRREIVEATSEEVKRPERKKKGSLVQARLNNFQ